MITAQPLFNVSEHAAARVHPKTKTRSQGETEIPRVAGSLITKTWEEEKQSR